MRARTLGVLTLLFTHSVAWGAFRFGLGNAVAHRGAELIDRANQQELVGERVAATLPYCSGNELFTVAPVDMSRIRGIDPLGHVQPTGHTMPSDHIYYYASTTTVAASPVYAPGDIHLTDFSSSRYLNASPVYTDYGVTFYACQNFRGFYGHIRTLTDSFAAKVAAYPQTCYTYSTGGSTIERCSANTNIPMTAGEIIGYTATTGAIDFGASDTRITPLGFVSPDRHVPYQRYSVCPIDYFSPGPRATMEAKLGRFDGGYPRVTAPICGTIDADVANTAKGYWYKIGAPDYPEDPHLSLIDNNVYAPQQTISVGNSLPNGGGLWYIFSKVSGAGQVDRAFEEVTADGNTYCYDTFYDPVGQAIALASAPVFILKMTSATTLRFEKQTSVGCGSGPWTFTSNAVDFQR